MPSLSSCPKCEKQVLVPDGTVSETVVQCPLCEEEYSLGEMFNDAPMLTIISGGPEPVAEAAGAGASIALVPLEGAEHEEEGGAEESPAFSFGPGDASDDFTAAMGGEDGATTATLEPTTKKTRKGPGAVGFILGIAIFGVIGLGLGYGILYLFWPDRAGQLRSQFARKLGMSENSSSGEANRNKPAGFVMGADRPQNENKDKNRNENKKKQKRSSTEQPSIKPKTPEFPFEATGDGPDPFAEVVVPAPTATALFDDRFSTDELSEALADASEELKASPDRLSGEAYKALCALGHRATFVVAAIGEQKRSFNLKKQITNLFSRAAADGKDEKIAIYSHRRLFSGKRKEDQRGIALVGEVQSVKTRQGPHGALFASELHILGNPDEEGNRPQERILVLSAGLLDFVEDDRVAILGSIVDDPAEKIPGYADDESIIVLSGVALTLPENEP